jgi:hypothetical protein
MAVEEEVKLGGVADASVHNGTRHTVAGFVLVVSVSWEESGAVVAVD